MELGPYMWEITVRPIQSQQLLKLATFLVSFVEDALIFFCKNSRGGGGPQWPPPPSLFRDKGKCILCTSSYDAWINFAFKSTPESKLDQWCSFSYRNIGRITPTRRQSPRPLDTEEEETWSVPAVCHVWSQRQTGMVNLVMLLVCCLQDKMYVCLCVCVCVCVCSCTRRSIGDILWVSAPGDWVYISQTDKCLFDQSVQFKMYPL